MGSKKDTIYGFGGNRLFEPGYANKQARRNANIQTGGQAWNYTLTMRQWQRSYRKTLHRSLMADLDSNAGIYAIGDVIEQSIAESALSLYKNYWYKDVYWPPHTAEDIPPALYPDPPELPYEVIKSGMIETGNAQLLGYLAIAEYCDLSLMYSYALHSYQDLNGNTTIKVDNGIAFEIPNPETPANSYSVRLLDNVYRPEGPDKDVITVTSEIKSLVAAIGGRVVSAPPLGSFIDLFYQEKGGPVVLVDSTEVGPFGTYVFQKVGAVMNKLIENASSDGYSLNLFSRMSIRKDGDWYYYASSTITLLADTSLSVYSTRSAPVASPIVQESAPQPSMQPMMFSAPMAVSTALTDEELISAVYVSFSGDTTPTAEEAYVYYEQLNSYIDVVVISMILQDGPFYDSLTAEGVTSEDMITIVYQAMFGRAPDAEGLAYWVERLNSSSITSVIIEILQGAKSNPDTADWDYVKSKIGTMPEDIIYIATAPDPEKMKIVITKQPVGAEYDGETPIKTLTISATAEQIGELSYTWYITSSNSASGGEALSFSNSVVPLERTVTQTDYYYCVVTNTLKDVVTTATSNVVSVAFIIAMWKASDGNSGKLSTPLEWYPVACNKSKNEGFIILEYRHVNPTAVGYKDKLCSVELPIPYLLDTYSNYTLNQPFMHPNPDFNTALDPRFVINTDVLLVPNSIIPFYAEAVSDRIPSAPVIVVKENRDMTDLEEVNIKRVLKKLNIEGEELIEGLKDENIFHSHIGVYLCLDEVIVLPEDNDKDIERKEYLAEAGFLYFEYLYKLNLDHMLLRTAKLNIDMPLTITYKKETNSSVIASIVGARNKGTYFATRENNVTIVFTPSSGSDGDNGKLYIGNITHLYYYESSSSLHCYTYHPFRIVTTVVPGSNGLPDREVITVYERQYEVDGRRFPGNVELLPMPLELYRQFTYRVWEAVYEYGTHLTVFIRQEVKLKWYQTTLFKVILIIILAIISYFTAGTTSSALVAFINSLSTTVAVGLSISLLVEAFVSAGIMSQQVGSAVMLVVSLIMIIYGGVKNGFTGEVWLQLGGTAISTISQTINHNVQKDIVRLQQDITELEEGAEEYKKLLEEAETFSASPEAVIALFESAILPPRHFKNGTDFCQDFLYTGVALEVDYGQAIKYNIQARSSVSLYFSF